MYSPNSLCNSFSECMVSKTSYLKAALQNLSGETKRILTCPWIMAAARDALCWADMRPEIHPPAVRRRVEGNGNNRDG